MPQYSWVQFLYLSPRHSSSAVPFRSIDIAALPPILESQVQDATAQLQAAFQVIISICMSAKFHIWGFSHVVWIGKHIVIPKDC